MDVMPNWLFSRAQASPNQPAIVMGGQSWTFAQLADDVGQLAASLSTQGVRATMRVAVWMPTGYAYVCAVHAVAQLGAVLVPLNIRLTGDEARWQLEKSQSQFLLVEAQAPFDLPESVHVIPLSMLEQAQAFETFPAQPVDLNAVQAIIFTSGTTGQPKGAQITFGNHFYSALGSVSRLGHLPNDRWLSVLPLYHVGGLAVLFRSVLFGITVILQERFEVAAMQASFADEGVTLVSLVPTMLYRLLEAETRFPVSLRVILLGGAAASAD
ncbi:MAG: AMP-binding protein, partial [Phototrophicaceae bacterium]